MKRNNIISKLVVASVVVVVTSGCSSLSSKASSVSVIEASGAALVSDCKRLGAVTKEAGGGYIGASNARTEAINGAAAYSSADTVVVASVRRGMATSRATAIAYDCGY